MGVSGVSVGLLLGVRKWIPLAAIALAGASVLRTWSAFAVWSLGRPDWLFESWLIVNIAVVLGAAATRWRHWKSALFAVASFGLASTVALATKYLLDIGERHHSDTSNVLALAVVAMQGEISDLSPLSDSFKRGISYPLMLSLGPEGRILGGFTPLIFLSLIGSALWISWRLLSGSVSRRVFFVSAAVIGVFSVSVPIFRVAMFYLNGHTLMAYGLVLLVGGVVVAARDESFGPTSAALVLLGGSLGMTSRIEGVVLVGIVLLLLTSQRWWSIAVDRVRFGLAVSLIGLSLTWWLTSLDSPVLEEFGLSGAWLLGASVLGGGIAASPWFDPIRRWLYPAVGLTILAYLGHIIWSSRSPLAVILTQWPNLGLGQGGWGTAALVFGGSVLLLGWRARPQSYRTLIVLVALLIAGILFSKTFDGGFGRPGFYDSVNRMWLHVMPVVIVASLVGYADMLQKVLSGRSPSHPVTEPRTRSARMTGQQ
jgi:hypothetical protein